MKFFNRLLLFFPYLIVFIFSLYTPLDPDLGWHLKYGEYFFGHGNVLRDNIFSTMMPGYHWANTSWMTDVVTYAVYHFGGFLGLTILGSLLVTATFFVFSKVAKLTLWDQSFLFPFLLYLEQPINAVSFRGQQISLLFLGVLFYLLSQYPKRLKRFYLVIPLFFLWANFHGEFLLGLVLFGLWIGLYFGQKLFRHPLSRISPSNTASMRNDVRELILPVSVLFGSVLVTFINPFGIGVYLATIDHIGSPLLKDIGEYLPFAMYSQVWWNEVIVAILLVVGFLYLFFRNKVASQIPLLGSILLIFLLSFEVRRYAWPAYYLTLPLLRPIAVFFKPDSKKFTRIFSIVLLFLFLGVTVWSRYPFTQFSQYTWDAYCPKSDAKCSPQSMKFLQEKKLTHNLLTLYSWGGWMIWNYPAVKPTIDGRMHLWQENGYSAFADYYEYEQNFKDIQKSSYDVVYMSPDKPIYTRLRTLVNQDKWDLVYEDTYAGIFVRKK